MSRRVHCQVLEVPAREDFLPRRGGRPRDLLPWADPYIAGLIQKLEDRYETGWPDSSDPFAEDDDLLGAADFDPPSAEWREDAFRPRPLEAPRQRWYSAVYGGFPLLDDDGEEDDAEKLEFR